jgi:hypothetical protein
MFFSFGSQTITHFTELLHVVVTYVKSKLKVQLFEEAGEVRWCI